MSNRKSEKEYSSDKELPSLESGEDIILKQQLETVPSTAGYFAIYRYATALDVVCILISIVACSAGGVGAPLMMIVVGSMTGSFSGFLKGDTPSGDFIQSVEHQVLYFLYIGIGQFVALTIGVYGLNYIGERITKKIQQAYLDAVLRQNIAFIDNTGAGEITVRISNDMSLIQDGISQKVGLIFFGLGGFFSAIVISFIKSWRLALVMLCLPLAIIMVMGGLGANMKKFQEDSNSGYAHSGGFAEEVISAIRNVTAFGSQQRFLKKYCQMLGPPETADFVAKVFLGAMIGIMMMIINLGFGLAASPFFQALFWQGNRFLQQEQISVADLITVLFTSGIAGVSLGHSAPFVAAISQAGAAASPIFAVIERKSPIDPTSHIGLTPESISGAIEFRNVRMRYPSRPNQLILDNFNLSVESGKTLAIVGPSGSGKSTLFSLLERLYLPTQGSIALDGHSINDLNIKWLRSQIGFVSQDNFLFNTSIYNNIAYGLGLQYNKMDDLAIMQRVQEAAKVANAHSFINELPGGYQASVGERGSRLSGGQRQRVAIARAIVSNPRILLLDEATAALDTKAERLVQEALFSAAKGRTTIIIAHRLSTIRKADRIVVVEHGRITEQGTHEELLAAGTMYAAFVKAQKLRHSTDSEEEETLLSLKETTTTNKPGNIRKEIVSNGIPVERMGDSSFGQLAKLVWELNHKERYHIIGGIIVSAIAGLSYSIQGIFFGNAVIAITNPQLSNGSHTLDFWCAMLLMLGLVLLVSYGTQGYLFAIAGSRLGSRARSQAFASILRQDMAFFDREENSSGMLTALLATKATKLTGISGNTFGALLNSLTALVSGIAVGCSYGWKLGLVAMATVPILILCSFMRFWIVTQTERRFKKGTEAASRACEAVAAIRTVAALTMEETIGRQYAASLMAGHSKNLALDFGSAVTYALSQSLGILVNGLLYWYGGTHLIATGEYTVQQFFVCYIAVVFSAQATGSLFSYAPEIAGAQEAAAHLQYIMQSASSIDAEHSGGEEIPNLKGSVELRDVDFEYNARPQHKVLRGVNLVADHGRFVALVGASGSGKTTALNLVERFYDPSSGSVTVDQKDMRRLDLKSFRKNVALVEQESALIGGTIRECILSDDESVADMAIEAACKAANIYDFVASLPEGLGTLIGARGNRVSGGQKQRLAIAKALLRDPKILLLDEATSALDSESERLVQRALESVSRGRTTIAVAHRLSSVAHADCIYVFDHGQVVESGTHEELIRRKGRYFELVSLQDLGQHDRAASK